MRAVGVALLIVAGAALVGVGTRLLLAALRLDRRWPRFIVIAVTVFIMLTSAATAAFAVFTASASDSIDIGSAETFVVIDAPECQWTEGDEVTLMWDADPDATSYDILRSTSPNSGYSSLANLDDSTFTYSDSTVNPGPRPVGTYYYKLQVNTVGAPKRSAFAVSTTCVGYLDTWAGGVAATDDATEVAMQPTALAVDGNDLLVMAQGVVRRIDLTTGDASVDAGIAGIGSDGIPGPAEMASIGGPSGVAVDGEGNRYITDAEDHVVYKVDSDNDVSIFAGQLDVQCADSLTACGDGGAATSAELNGPVDIAFDLDGNAYISDSGDQRIRRVAPGGTITTVVGSGTSCTDSTDPCGDGGAGTSADLNNPAGLVWAESLDGLIIADSLNFRLRFWDGANITAFAGDGLPGTYGNDGGLGIPTFDGPVGVAQDGTGSYIAEASGHVRKFDGGAMSTIAGIGSDAADAPLGDLGPATEAAIPDIPVGGIAAWNGSVFVSDPTHRRVRVITPAGTIATYAGTGDPCVPASGCGDGDLATDADITPGALTVDDRGGLYIADPTTHQIRRVSRTGVITLIAGTGDACAVSTDPCGDGGAAVDAELNTPGGMYFEDGSRTLILADTGNRRIRLIGIDSDDNSMLIVALAGTGAVGNSGDGGPASAATFDQPVAVTLTDTDLLVADVARHRVRAIDSLGAGNIRAFAGDGTEGNGGDNAPAVDAQLGAPVAFLIADGTPYILDRDQNRVRGVNGGGDINNALGNADGSPATFGGDGGDPLDARFLGPARLAWDDDDQQLYVADPIANRIRLIDVDAETIDTVAGVGGATFTVPGDTEFYHRYFGDGGDATEAGLAVPFGVALDAAGNLYIAEFGNARVRKVAVGTREITTVGGTGHRTSANGATPTEAQFGGNGVGMARDSAGNTYVADDRRIAKIAPDGTTTTYAGTGAMPTWGGDGGRAVDASLEPPTAIAQDGLGNVYVATVNRIRKIAPDGSISAVAGTDVSGYEGDGSDARTARINVAGLTADESGNLYFSDYDHHVIRKIDSDHVITTIAGNGSGGFAGDGGPPASAQLNGPFGIAYVGGQMYVADSLNQRIRAINVGSDEINTVAGNGTEGFSGDGGVSIDAQLDHPTALAADVGGVAFYDSGNQRIRTIGGTIETVVGTGSSGNTGDGGPGTSATIGNVFGLGFNTVNGSLYISDSTYNRIRELDNDGDIHALSGSTAGTAGFAGDNGAASAAGVRFDDPLGISVSMLSNTEGSQARILVTDSSNSRVRSIALDRDYVSTFAGDGATPTHAGDGGQAADAAIDVTSIAASADGVVYFYESIGDDARRIRKIGTNGVISTVVGMGGPCFDTFCDDGVDPLESGLGVVTSLAVGHGTSVGGFYTGDVLFFTEEARVRVAVPGVSVDNFAGTHNSSGFSGDGGPATSATLDSPWGLAAIGEYDNPGFGLYIVDRNNNRVRFVNDTGDISTVAGDGSGTISGNGGAATSAGVPLPRFVAVNADGDLYIVGGDGDPNASALRKVDEASGNISSIAGDGTFGFRGDRGGAADARFGSIAGLTLDDDGNIYVIQLGLAHRIRRIAGPL